MTEGDQMDVCQASLNGRGEIPYSCTEDGVTGVRTVTLGCVHEHIFDVILCEAHAARVETDAHCPQCGLVDTMGDRRHRCPVRVLTTAVSDAG